FIAPLQRLFGAHVVAVDPSRNMLGVAAANGAAGRAYIQAMGGRVPLRGGCADLSLRWSCTTFWTSAGPVVGTVGSCGPVADCASGPPRSKRSIPSSTCASFHQHEG